MCVGHITCLVGHITCLETMQSFRRDHCKLIKIWCLNLPICTISGAGQQLLLLGINLVVKIAREVQDPISFHEFAMDCLKTLQLLHSKLPTK